MFCFHLLLLILLAFLFLRFVVYNIKHNFSLSLSLFPSHFFFLLELLCCCEKLQWKILGGVIIFLPSSSLFSEGRESAKKTEDNLFFFFFLSFCEARVGAIIITELLINNLITAHTHTHKQ